MKWFWKNAEPLGAVLMSIAALAALLYAHVQITEGREAERRANVHELWREILRLGFENPVLSDRPKNSACSTTARGPSMAAARCSRN